MAPATDSCAPAKLPTQTTPIRRRVRKLGSAGKRCWRKPSNTTLRPRSRITGEFVAKIYAGTSGWAYPSWKPDFYPAKLPSAKFLAHYAEGLNTVEVNYTFRRFPTEKLLRGWIAATPPEFQFAVKANQKITHISRLKNVADFTSDFLGALARLATET